MTTVMIIIISSALTSILTILFTYLIFTLFLKNAIARKIDHEVTAIKTEFEKGLLETGEELLPEFRKELAEAFALEVKEFLPEFRHEVSEGFKEAGEELLPHYRSEVQEAFETALVRVMGGKLVEKTAVKMAETGTSIVGTGLDLLFGKRNKGL